MQKVVNVYYSRSDSLEELNRYLNAGWVVVLMQSFSESVSISLTGEHSNKDYMKGHYGMTFVLQKTDDNRKH